MFSLEVVIFIVFVRFVIVYGDWVARNLLKTFVLDECVGEDPSTKEN
jgi:hypothetical protein